MSDQLTNQMLEQWKDAAEAAANPPDRAEVREQFGDFLTAQLGEGTSPTSTGVAASLQAHLTNDQEN